MSLVDPPAGPEDDRSPAPRPSIPVRSGPRGQASASHAAVELVPLAQLLENCPLFNPDDESLGNFASRMVPSNLRLGIRVRIHTGMNRITLKVPAMDLDVTPDTIHRRWGPGRYYVELVPLGAEEGGGAAANPFKSRALNIEPSDHRPELDVGVEPLPIEWDTNPNVTADMKAERRRRDEIRASGRAIPWDPEGDDDEYGFDPNDPRAQGEPGFDPNDPRAQGGGGFPQQHPGFPGAPGAQPFGPFGQPAPGFGQPGMAPPFNPYGFAPGTPFVVGPNGQWMPQPPAAPPPLTAADIAAAVAAALPKREPSVLEQMFTGLAGVALAALQANPAGTLQQLGALMRPAPPPAPPPAPTAAEIAASLASVIRPAEAQQATMRLELEKVALQNQLALERQSAKNDLDIQMLRMEKQIEVARAQAAAATAAHSQNAATMTDAVTSLKSQYDALKAQIAAGQGDENAWIVQVAELAKSPAVEMLIGMGKEFLAQRPQALPQPAHPQFAPTAAPSSMPPFDPNAQPSAAPSFAEQTP